MKDAQWIIDRRARQMKEIRDRQKAEVRAGNPHFDTRKSAKGRPTRLGSLAMQGGGGAQTFVKDSGITDC
eukprot:7961805-Pyramimonas_sp.AAC.1